MIGAGIVYGPVATPLTSTRPTEALRIFDVGVLIRRRLRASSENRG